MSSMPSVNVHVFWMIKLQKVNTVLCRCVRDLFRLCTHVFVLHVYSHLSAIRAVLQMKSRTSFPAGTLGYITIIISKILNLSAFHHTTVNRLALCIKRHGVKWSQLATNTHKAVCDIWMKSAHYQGLLIPLSLSSIVDLWLWVLEGKQLRGWTGTMEG